MKNRKLFISILTGLCACLMSATLFTACGETHTHSYTSQTTTEATCREKGLTTYTCSCGDTYTEEILTLGHDTKTHEAQAPTCTEKGWSEYVTCEREGCDYSTYEEILALKHDIVNHEGQAPTCTEIGWNEYVTCERDGCEYSTYEEIPATSNHTWNDGEITTEPTCTETGVKTFTCTVCETATKTENVNALMHDIKVNDSKAPTCTEIGWNAYATCKREGCDYTTYEELPATGVHTWNDGEETISPTCTEKGETTYTCTVCKTATKTEPIQTLPHDHAEEWTYDESNHWHECKCGDKTDEGEHIPSAPATATTPQTCTICGYVIQGETGIVFNTLTTNGNKVNGTVSNTKTEFSFLDEITVKGNAQFIVALDKNGMQTVITKKITLQEGDNTVYVFETLNGEITNTYTVTIRRRPMYNVTFNEKGGTMVANQSIEEGFLATAPETTRTGYTFVEWDYDFTTPITKDTEITALWKANENTKYIVNYYAQNIENDEYTLFSTEELTGTTDTTATATINQYEHFTYNEKLSTVKGNIDGDGSLVLSVYYTRDKYTIKTGYIIKYFDDYTASKITQTETWKCGTELTCSVSNLDGYTWLGWYEDIGSDMAQLVTNEQSFAFIVDKNVTYYQCWQANTDTKYTVNYYLQNIEDDEYTLYETEELTGMTDTLATATIKEYEHFTYNESVSTISGYIQGDGSLGLSVYYTRNTYTLSVNDSSIGSITNAGPHKYGKTIKVTATSQLLGYGFLGWYNGEELLSTDTEYTFMIEKYVTAKFAVKEEMLHFSFTSTATVCKIIGVEDREATEIIIPDYVTDIGEWAFSACSNLTSVKIGNSVTSIGEYAFGACSSLTSITIPDSVTFIGNSAFNGCNNLTDITLPFVGATPFASEYKAVFGYIFGYTTYDHFSDVYFGTYTPNKATCQYDNESTYYYYEIPNTLKSVTITRENIPSYAFKNCDNLTSVTIGNSVTSIGEGAFSSCSSLTSIVIPDSVTSIGSCAFDNCDSLMIVTIGNGVTSIGNSAFAYCDRLTKVTIGDNVTSIGDYAFSSCSSLTSITVSANNTAYKSIDGNLYSKNGTTLIQYAIGKTATTFTIPDSVTSIGNRAFEDCSSLTSVTIGNGVTSIGDSAFGGCDDLTSVTIPDSVTSIGNRAFEDCSSLTSVTIGNGVTSIGDSAFEYCSSLTSVTIPDSVKTIGSYAFYDCISLTSVTIGNSVTSIGEGAFSSCSSLTSIVIPDSVTSIGSCAFDNCDSLMIVTIGNGVTSIGNSAFAYCDRLTTVTIGDGVTSIGEKAFYDCSSLTNVTIGDSVTSIGSQAFYDCGRLKSITFKDTSTWYITTNSSNWENKTGGSKISVTSSSTNATNLKSTFDDYYWYKL